MSISKKQQLKLKVIAATSIAIFSLAVCFTGTYAWFISKINNDTNAEKIAIKYSGEVRISSGYRVFEYDFDNEVPKESETLKLHGYDCFIEQKNEYNKKYVVADLLFPNGIPANSALKITMNAPTDNYYNGTKVADYISNLIQFKFIDNKNEGVVPITGKTATQIYNACNTAFESVSSYDTFVTNMATGNKQTIDNRTLPLPQSSATGLDGYKTQLLIEYTYNQELIDYYKEKSGYNYDVKYFEQSITVNFAGDIASIFFDVGPRA